MKSNNSKSLFPSGVAIVIGGSGGIGSAICTALAHAGTEVVLTYNNNQDSAEETVERIVAGGGKAKALKLNLKNHSHCREIVNSIADQYNSIHTVVNATGSDIRMRYISELSQEEWASVIETDLNGFFNLASAALPHLRRSKGSLIALSSIGVERWPKRDVLSVAPKAAIESLIRGIAKEEGRYGVRANSILLGVIDAGIFHRLKRADFDKDWEDAARENTALKRFGAPGEVADAVVFLASIKASYITGQSLKLDGGYSI